ncbi:hypothetical protein L593_12035 [Salinarchaeum sp. Harcht-Bsk1]|uniref:hypothetical protein n=1 Tax=Salinarchaeum sp. Harcht-Bsk1 TaxID=1333523 RepID=UPI0003423908|nr:hypothetical protein [Salinarchaeum sp. Harcht-Bsk1]AGN02350.1 hypothetical protein L593_12035 [Salinarchaeum sp. Harcht-Bsk1]
MRAEDDIRRRLEDLEARYDDNDPPSSPTADELEVELLRAIAELEWVLDERSEPQELPPDV